MFARPLFLYPPKCPLPDENPACFVLLIFLFLTVALLETGLSHPLLTESSFGGRTKKSEQMEQYSPQCRLKLKSSVLEAQAPCPQATPRQLGR